MTFWTVGHLEIKKYSVTLLLPMHMLMLVMLLSSLQLNNKVHMLQRLSSAHEELRCKMR